MEYPFETGEEYAQKLDRDDPLAGFRQRFFIPEGTIYVDGNSLGLLSEQAEASLLRVISEWKSLGIGGWLDAEQPWFYFAETLGDMASNLVGAKREEVVATGTTTTNIHSLVSTLYRPEGRRTKIIVSADDFPTDIYALKSQIQLKGLDPGENLVLTPAAGETFIDEEDVIECMNDEIALILLPSVFYRSGQLLDIPRLTGHAHKRGIVIGFDCSHSVGAVPHHFDEWDVDFAVWCSYKYVNGGPGGPAFIYINERYFDREPAITGWFGFVKEKQFDMLLDFEHEKNAGGWQISSPSILGAAAVEGALRIMLEAGIEPIRRKSLTMTSYLIHLIDNTVSADPYNFAIGTPREQKRRGGHVAVRHPKEAVRICEALKAKGVIPDFRTPDIIRIAPVALYNTFHEIWRIVQLLKEIIDGGDYKTFPGHRRAIP